jgi:hypothetical protein
LTDPAPKALLASPVKPARRELGLETDTGFFSMNARATRTRARVHF